MNTIILEDKIVYQVTRCGIIPYYQIDNDHFMLLMPFKRYYEDYNEKTFHSVKHLLVQNGGAFGDFGGGIKTDESYLSGLIREVEEESNNIFGAASSFIKESLLSSRTQLLVYKAKSLQNKIYLEYLIDVKEDRDYVNKYQNNGTNDEHEYVKWQSVKRNHEGIFKFVDIHKKDIDKAIYPLFYEILKKFKQMTRKSKKVNISKSNESIESTDSINEDISTHKIIYHSGEKSYREIISDFICSENISDDIVISNHKIIDHDKILPEIFHTSNTYFTIKTYFPTETMTNCFQPEPVYEF